MKDKLEGTLYIPNGKATHLNLVTKILGEVGYRILLLHPNGSYDYNNTKDEQSEEEVKRYLSNGTILDINLSEVVREAYNETR